jgi:hypothetical protein
MPVTGRVPPYDYLIAQIELWRQKAIPYKEAIMLIVSAQPQIPHSDVLDQAQSLIAQKHSAYRFFIKELLRQGYDYVIFEFILICSNE